MSGTGTRALALALAALAACSGGGSGPPDPGPAPSVTVTPATATVAAGGAAVQLTATLAGVEGTVAWSIDTAGPDVGTVTQAGLYAPPAALAAAKDVVVRAAVGTISGTATVHVTPAAHGATLQITTPRPLAPVVAGSGDTRAVHVETSGDPADVGWTLSPALGSLSATSGADVVYTAPSQFVSAPTVVTLTAALASPALEDSIAITVTPTPLAVAGPAVVRTAGGTAQYAVTTDVGGAAVAWSLVPADGSVGSISPSGVYTPPSTHSGPARTFQVVATAGQATGALTVTLEPATIAISAPAVTVASGGTIDLTATVDPPAGAAQLAWTVVSGGGAIAPSGNPATYTAPTVVTDTLVTVRASAAGASATATLTVLAPAAPAFAITTARPLAPVAAGSGATRAVHVETTADPATVSWTLGPTLGALSAASGADVTYTAPAQLVTAPTTVTITAALSSFALEDSITVVVTPTALAVAGAASVQTAGSTAQYAVTTDVGGAAVAWSLVPSDGSVGTITSAGLYTPPSTLSGPARTFAVVATIGQATGSLAVTLEPATIAISAPAGVVASGATLDFTATVAPPQAAAQLEWTVVSGGGAIAPSGNPATYTAPTVQADTAVTVLASAAGASATATVTVLAAGGDLAVAGRVVGDDRATPVAGAEVFLGSTAGPRVTTGADGAFGFAGVAPPYALVVVAPAGADVRVFEGLTVASPAVSVPAGLAPHSALLTGVVRQDEELVLATVSSDLADGNQQRSDAGSGAYAIWVDWYGAATRGGTVRAIRTQVDAVTGSFGYRYGTAAFTATASGSSAADVSLADRPLTGPVGGTVSAPGFDFIRAAYVTAFAPADWLESFDVPLAATTFSYMVPELPGKVADFLVVSGFSGSARAEHAVRAAAGTAGLALSLPTPPAYTAPANGATIGYQTPLQWTAPPGGSSRIYVECNAGTAASTRYEIVTTGTSTRIPDLSAAGVDPSGPCTWWVDWQSASVDWTLREDFTELQESRYVWGQGSGSVILAP